MRPAPQTRIARTTRIAALLSLLLTAICAYAAERILSPDRKWAIEANVRDPGNVGAPQTIVTLYPAKQKVPTYEDNILIVEGTHTISVKWESKKAVTITCAGCDIENAEFQATRLDDVIITYLSQ